MTARVGAGWRLADFAKQELFKKAKLLLPEVAGVRLYTGPMYSHYQRTLRERSKGTFVTTLHAINSAVLKCSRHTKAVTVYRGLAGMQLPKEFHEENMGVKGANLPVRAFGLSRSRLI
jgi:hypothetical protein